MRSLGLNRGWDGIESLHIPTYTKIYHIPKIPNKGNTKSHDQCGVGCQIFLEIQNPWGKEMERSGLRFEHFCLKIFKNCRAKKSFFCLLIFPYKTWWKPRFLMD